MSVLPLTYSIDLMYSQSKSQKVTFVDFNKLTLNFIGRGKRLRIANTMLKNKNNPTLGINIKLQYSRWCGVYKIYQWDRTDISEIDP